MRNQSFAFLKPHAMGSQPVVNAVADRLEEAGVRVSHMERIGADRLVAEGLYDRHVGPVARAALAPDPAALFDADARARFAERFEEPFADVVAEGRLLSAPAAAARFEGGPDEVCLTRTSTGAGPPHAAAARNAAEQTPSRSLTHSP